MLPPELLIYLLVNKSAREGTKDVDAILDELTEAMLRARSRPVAHAAKQFQAWYARINRASVEPHADLGVTTVSSSAAPSAARQAPLPVPRRSMASRPT